MFLFAIPSAVWLLGVTIFLFFFSRKWLPFFSSTKLSSHLSLPPGPRGMEATKSIVRGIRSGAFHQEITTWGQAGSPITCCSGPIGTFVSLNSPEMVRDMLSGRDTETLVNSRPETFIGPFLFYGPKDMAMSSVTPEWTAQRKMFHSALRLYGDGVRRFESTVQGELGLLTAALDEKDGEDVVIEDHVSITLLNILCILMIGERPNKDCGLLDVMRRLDHVISRMGTPSVDVSLKLFPVLRFLPGWYKTHCDEALYCRNKLMEIMFDHSKATVVDGQPRGIVDVMILAQRSGSFAVSDAHIKGLIIDILAGGYVTSLTSILSIVLVLLNTPSVARAIQKEIDDVLGQRTPTLDDRSAFHFTEATVLEMFRYTRLFPLGVAHIADDEMNFAGYFIPKGALIFANQWQCGRDVKTWDMPEQFMPQRFLDDNGRLLPPDHPRRRNLLPFGIGKRACPGETFARSRLFLLITTLLQRFDILPPENGEVIPLDKIEWTSGAVLSLPTFPCKIRRRAA